MGMNTPLLVTDAGRLPNRLVRAGLFCAFLAVSFAASAQRLRSTTVLVSGQKGVEFNDSTEVWAQQTETGYTVQRRVWIQRKALGKDSTVAAETALLGRNAQPVGTALTTLKLHDVRPSEVAGLRRHYIALVRGTSKTTAFYTNSFPDRALVELLSEKRVGPFGTALKNYLETFGFQKVSASKLPEELNAAGDLEVWVLRHEHQTTQEPAPARLVLVVRSDVALAAVVHADGPLMLPKLKETRNLSSGSYHYFAKPAKSFAEGLELAVYGLSELVSADE